MLPVPPSESCPASPLAFRTWTWVTREGNPHNPDQHVCGGSSTVSSLQEKGGWHEYGFGINAAADLRETCRPMTQDKLKATPWKRTCSERARLWRRAAGILPPSQAQRLLVWWRSAPPLGQCEWTLISSWCRRSRQPSAGWRACGRSGSAPPECRETSAIWWQYPPTVNGW